MDKLYVAYYRVSTVKQGESGLGLDAQKAAVKAFLKCEDCIIGEFTEVESGKKDKRPQLLDAIKHAKATGSTLVIAKLDRLSRNAGFIFSLRDSGVDFVCADMPDANTLTIGIFAVLAQHERELISSRTKAALKAKKEQGHVLGKPENLTEAARLKGLETRKANAANNLHNTQAMELAIMYREKGFGLQSIAEKLNKGGYTTRNGKQFEKMTVKRLLERHSAQQPIF